MTEGDVWARLYEVEAFNLAENIFAASMGADVNHEVLLAEIQRLSDWVFETADAGNQAERFVHAVAALLILGRASLEQFAAAIEESKLGQEGGQPDPEAVRNTAMYLLNQYSGHMREQLG